MVGDGYRLPPSPGCPRAVYKLMILCWYDLALSAVHSDHILQPINNKCLVSVHMQLYTNTSIHWSSVPGTPRPPLDQDSPSCCKPSVSLRLNSSAGLRRTWGSTHKLQCWGLPWRLAKSSTLNCSRCTQKRMPLVILNYSTCAASNANIMFCIHSWPGHFPYLVNIYTQQ